MDMDRKEGIDLTVNFSYLNPMYIHPSFHFAPKQYPVPTYVLLINSSFPSKYREFYERNTFLNKENVTKFGNGGYWF